MKERIKSLSARGHELANVESQLDVLSDSESVHIPAFSDKIEDIGLFPLKPVNLDIFQINVGKMCNQVANIVM